MTEWRDRDLLGTWFWLFVQPILWHAKYQGRKPVANVFDTYAEYDEPDPYDTEEEWSYCTDCGGDQLHSVMQWRHAPKTRECSVCCLVTEVVE